MLKQLCMSLIDRGRLSAAELRTGLETLMRGEFNEAEAAAFLTALRLRGESAEDLTVAATVLRERMTRLETGGRQVLDTCGTGGDGAGTFNISTAVALIVAACGLPVVKHGNRGASSVTGSADVMAALGVRIDAPPPLVQRSLHEVGLGFCFAPVFHPAMRHVVELRRRLGFRTIFNLIGPLVNPAQPAFQLIGVSRLDVLDRLACCLAQLGAVTAHLVHGQDGLDEVTLGAPTSVRYVHDGQVESLEWTPETFGLPRRRLEDVRVNSIAESATLVRQVITGEPGALATGGNARFAAATDFVLANSAAALYTAKRVSSLPEGVQLAGNSLNSRAARQVLDRLIAVTTEAS
jgi:anthranilate phosphoribosyltransferase